MGSSYAVGDKGRTSLTTRIRVWSGLVGVGCLAATLIADELTSGPNSLWVVVFGALCLLLTGVWLILSVWQGIRALCRLGLRESLRLPTLRLWLHYGVFLILVGVPIGVLFWFLMTPVPRTNFAADGIGMRWPDRMVAPIGFLAAIQNGWHAAIWLPLVALAAVAEWRLAWKTCLRVRLVGLGILAVVIWMFSLWMFAEIAWFTSQTAWGLESRRSSYRSALMQIGYLSQADARYARAQQELAALRAGHGVSRGVPQPTSDPAALSRRECQNQVWFLNRMAESKDPVVRSRAAATLVLLRERIERDSYLASDVLTTVCSVTGQDFQSLDEAAEWLKGKGDDPDWQPMSLMRFAQ